MSAAAFLDVVDPWINWTWLSTHIPLFADALQQHITLTTIAIVGGLVLSLPLGVAAYRWRMLRNLVLGVFGTFYTIPSLALFALLVPYTGLSETTAEVGLIGYTVLILVRNVIVGLESVPADVLDAADGMGYRPLARLLRIELPLALPAIIAGVRIATVTTPCCPSPWRWWQTSPSPVLNGSPFRGLVPNSRGVPWERRQVVYGCGPLERA